MRHFFILAACIAVVATPAAAVVKIATYSGRVTDSIDQTGMFGTPGGSLDGLSFVVKYTYDISLGHRYNPSYADQISGGTLTGYATPMISTTLTINGITKSIGATYYGLAAATENHVQQLSQDYLANSLAAQDSSISNSASILSGTPDLGADVARQRPGNPSGSFSFTLYDFVKGKYSINTRGTFVTSFVSINNVSGSVPEPASWMLMIAGFGLVGAVARSRRKRLAAA